MLVNKELITKWLDNLKIIMRQEEQLNDILRDISPDFGGYSNDIAVNTILKMLKSLMEDKYEWLDYYIFELKWGSTYKEGMISDEFGNEIPLRNYDDLFNIIKSKNKNHRTLKEYKEDVFDLLDDKKKLEWMYNMSKQLCLVKEKIKDILKDTDISFANRGVAEKNIRKLAKILGECE